MTPAQPPTDAPESSARSRAADAAAEQVGEATAIFLDPSGRRWRRARRTGAVIALVMVLLAAWALPIVLSSPSAAGVERGGLLSKHEVGTNAPVIGQGPLTQMVRLDRAGTTIAAADVFTGEPAGTLSPSDARRAGDARYAVQHYGYSATARKTLSLTYDDGPNPKVTPTLLDLLGREHVPATFFVVGRYAVQNEALLQRMIREGHAVGLHTITHPDISIEPDWRERVELVGTERAVRSITGRSAHFWRMPFDSPDEDSNRRTVDGLLRAQHLGYVHASYDFDTDDWQYAMDPHATAQSIPLPDLRSGQNITVLMHDAGGPNRERTVQYTRRLIAAARAHGYTFTTMPQVVPAIAQGNTVAEPGWADRAWVLGIKAMYQWPDYVMRGLFLSALLFVVVVGLGQVLLAVVRSRRRAAIAWPAGHELGLSVSVVLAAYEEEPVIARTVRSILASEYPIAEVLVVDDGSKDATSEQVLLVAAEDSRVTLLRQANSGKAGALNNGVARAVGDIVVTLDADTIVTPTTVTRLVRHFALDPDGRLGAVAGVVRVGNREKNLLTRWQALEYVTQIGIERAAQDVLGAISIIPGACAAWRKEAILAAGGYSTITLAEDCDLALTMHEHGWRVTQDDEALAFTEAPETVDDLLAQRTRWTFGTLQAVVKHRGLLFDRRHGWLGWFVLPSYLMSILTPLVFIPFVLAMAVLTIQLEGPGMLLKFFLAFLAVQTVIAAIGLRLMRDDVRQVAVVPLYRVVYEPLRAYLLYSSALIALKGVRMGWNKLVRTGSMDAAHASNPTGSGATAGTALAAGAAR